MSERFPVLSTAALGALAGTAERGVLVAPFSALQVGRLVSKSEQAEALRLLEILGSTGMTNRQLAVSLRAVEAAHQSGEARPAPTLVWSDLDTTGSRDTGIVCQELFRGARKSVLLSTFSLGHKAKPGEAKGNPVLLPLARRMEEVEELKVRLFINLRRLNSMPGASAAEVEHAFFQWFRHEIWPWERLPEIYYDPRSLSADLDESACLHAKCVVVDDARAFLTSANLTEAAHLHNIEAGVLIDDATFARTLRKQLESLIDRSLVRRLIWEP